MDETQTLLLKISYPDLSTTNTSLPSSFYSLTPLYIQLDLQTLGFSPICPGGLMTLHQATFIKAPSFTQPLGLPWKQSGGESVVQSGHQTYSLRGYFGR